MTAPTLPRNEDYAFAEALDAMGEDSELLREIFEIFLETGEEQFRQLEICIAGNDVAQMRTVAHGVKSSAASIGAVGLADVARELEFLARDGGGPEAPVLLNRLREKYTDLVAVHRRIDWDDLPRLEV